jgi:hypothetical protein
MTKQPNPGPAIAAALLLDLEVPELFLDRLAEVEDCLKPRSVLERMVAQYITISSWRIARLINLEKSVIDWQTQRQTDLPDPCYPSTAAALALADNSRCLDVMGRSEARAFAAFENALNLFLKLRKELPPPDAQTPAPERTRL